jgi:hypothetical protein
MTAEACREWRGEVAALALGREDTHTTRALAHVDGCGACRAELAELQRTAALLALADPAHLAIEPAPPADLATRIVRHVRAERDRTRRVRRRHRLSVSLAVAACALVVAGLFAVRSGSDGVQLQAFTTAAPGVDGRFGLDANEQGTAVRLTHEGLDPAEVYWLWLTDDSGRRVSAGTFRGAVDGDHELVLQSALPLDDAVRVWVTDEQDTVVLDALLS